MHKIIILKAYVRAQIYTTINTFFPSYNMPKSQQESFSEIQKKREVNTERKKSLSVVD
jgi:hypothetical protein